MTTLKKIQRAIETVNTYYGFAVLVYAFVLYALSYSEIFVWILLFGLPLLTAWGGYLVRPAIDERTKRYGFKTISESMIYEIGQRHTYTLHFTSHLQAQSNHLMTYPIGYQWSGKGVEGVPRLAHSDQQLLVPLQKTDNLDQALPYHAMTVATEGDWRYWFVAFNPPIHQGTRVEIKYTQNFLDKEGAARPYLYYFVRTTMKQLELSVKFPPGAHPSQVTSSYIKPSDPNRPYLKAGVVYDPDKQWATWVVHRPRVGYCYRIDWQ